MNRRLMTTMVMAASLLASEAMYAAPVAFHVPVHAMFSRDKLVNLSLRNNTQKPIHVKAGDTEMTLEAGKTVAIRLHAGEKVVVEDGSPTIASGTVLVVASSSLSGGTILIN